ncbi:MAG: hypothetical protein PVG74_17835 [Desulfobacterales bacterium]|jgi:hypothetical protein
MPDLSLDIAGFVHRMASFQDDLLNFVKYVPEEIEIIVCMGDTLTHLKNRIEIEQ